MSANGSVHDTPLRDALGAKDLHASADEPLREEKATYVIRSIPGRRLPENYSGLIYAKWLRALRYGNDYFKLIDAESYFKSYNLYLSQILNKPQTVVRLAVLSDDEDVVLGFSVCRDRVLDFVYVHRDNRKIGIGGKLVPPDTEMFTHVTNIGLSIWGSKYPHLLFNPFA